VTIARYGRPYLDSSVYIAAIKDEENRALVVRQILEAAEKREIQIVASTFVAAEVIRMKGESLPLSSEKESEIDDLLKSERILWVELDLTVALEARKLARVHGLKPADAVHLASAIRAKADVLFRYDDRFASANEVAGLALCEPFWFGDASFPELVVEESPTK